MAFHPGLRPSAWSWAIIRPSFQDSGTGQSQISSLRDADDSPLRSFRIQTGCQRELRANLRQPSENKTRNRPVRGPGLQHQVSGIMLGVQRISATHNCHEHPGARMLKPFKTTRAHRR